MKLTGKALEDFLKVFGVDDEDKQISLQYFYNKTEVEQNALIVDWFDSVGIYISINYVNFVNELTSAKGFEAMVTNKHLTTRFREVEIRNEATRRAIIKANELYNYENR